jgi:hypothetical protein
VGIFYLLTSWNSGDRRNSNSSGSPVADLDLAIFDDGRNLMYVPVEFEHALHSTGVGFHVEVLDFDVFLAIVLTGGRRIRSARLTENQYPGRHDPMITDGV